MTSAKKRDGSRKSYLLSTIRGKLRKLNADELEVVLAAIKFAQAQTAEYRGKVLERLRAEVGDHD